LPAGKVFINILEFSQLPRADFAAPAHFAATIYALRGNTTIAVPRGVSQSLAPGEAAFVPMLSGHTIQNLDGTIGVGAIAAGLVVVVILLCGATWLRGSRRRITVAGLSIVLIAGGAWPLTGAASNDYYLIAVRPRAQNALPMPRPDGRVAYTAPDIDPVPAGPYVETLAAITVPAGARYETPDIPGPQIIVVVGGNATAQLGEQTSQLGGGGGAFAQMGQTLTIVNSGSNTLRVLDFAVTSATAPAA
jgi:type IV secretory pathway VirB2 component (pilin)